MRTADDAIMSSLGIVPMDDDKKLPAAKKYGALIDQQGIDKTDADHDFDRARRNTHELLDDAMEAVKGLAQLSTASQDPEHYASLASLIRAAAGLNRDLITMHKKTDTQQQQPVQVTTNNLTLTTAQLQELIEGKK